MDFEELMTRFTVPANQPGHVYVFRNKDTMLYLGHGTLTQLGGAEALSMLSGHVYMQLNGFMNYMNTCAAMWSRGADEALVVANDLLRRTFITVQPGALRYHPHRSLHTVYVHVLKHPKRGMSLGMVLDAEPQVLVTTGHDVTFTNRKGVCMYVDQQTDAPALMYMNR
jgi:hypothetical protein